MFEEMDDSIEKLLRQVIGVGWKSRAIIFIEEEIDYVAFYSLDKEMLKEAGKNFGVAPAWLLCITNLKLVEFTNLPQIWSKIARHKFQVVT